MKDSRGLEVQEGNSVVYAVRSGSWMTLRNGKVVEVLGDIATVEVELTEWEKKQEEMGWSKIRRRRKVGGTNLMKVSGIPNE